MASIPSVIETSTVVVSAVFPVLALLSVVLRFWARAIAKQRLMADDWWIVVAWVTTLALSVLVWVFGALAGVNYLKADTHTALLRTTQCLYAQAFTLQVALATVKISILLFYKRIFAVPIFKSIANVVMALIAAWVIIYIFLFVFENDPVRGSVTGEGHQVISFTQIGISQAITSICLDVLILCLPLHFVIRLHMRTARKWAVIIIFWLGGFCVVAAILRLVFLVSGIRATDSTRSGGGFTGLHDDAKTALFITIEPNCSIIAACLPCYGPLLVRGRKLESMIRSARSALSLSSLGSGGRNASRASRDESGTSIDKGPKSRRATVDANDANGDIRLEGGGIGKGWPHAQHVVSVAPVAPSLTGDQDHFGIEVTRGFESRNETI